VRQLEDATEAIQFGRIHAQFTQAAQRGVLPQQTHHDRFAMEHGNDGNADVHFAIIDADLDTTVLRQPLFGDVQMAENLDAGNDGGLKPLELGRDRDFLEHAIDPVANAKLMFEGFEMDIRRPQFDGVAQHLVDEADDGRIFRRGVQIGVFLGAILADDCRGASSFQRADGIAPTPRRFFISAGSPRSGPGWA